jgi:DnaK suppressor protein
MSKKKPKKVKPAAKKRKGPSVIEIVTFPAKLLEPIGRFLSGEAKRLEQRKKRIAKADPFADTRRLVDNAAADSDADEQIGHERATAMKTQTDRRLIQIRKALTRLKIGKYGICEKCGKMIDTDRLMVMPEATRCVKCSQLK